MGEGRDTLLRRLPARAQVERLHLDSAAFRSQQGPGHAAGGGVRGGRHIDDEGVVALVDALCKRRGGDAGARPGARGTGGAEGERGRARVLSGGRYGTATRQALLLSTSYSSSPQTRTSPRWQGDPAAV